MKKAIVVIVCLAAIGFAGWRMWPRTIKPTPEMMYRPRVCEKCNERFEGPTEDILVECPKCHERAGVRVFVRECRKCKARFDAFYAKPADPDLTEIDPMKPPPAMLYKRPDGDWKRSRRQLGEIKCPKCGSADVGPIPLR